MTSYYSDESVTIHHGDCLDVMRTLPDASVDAVVTDPPYGLANTDPAHVAETITRWVNGDRDYLPGGSGFMGETWDAFVPPVAVWDECLRVLKPGGHVLTFAGSRTMDLMTLGLRLAGFEIRDSIAWLYGSGFPKSLDVSKAIDKDNGRKFEDRFALGRHIRERREALGLTTTEVNGWFGYRDGCQHWERQDRSGARVPTLADWRILRERLDLSDEHLPLVERVEAEREVVGLGQYANRGRVASGSQVDVGDSAASLMTAPATPDAERWQGWGSAMKPAFEPVVVARKPLIGTIAQNVLEHGTGALNIDATRIGTDDHLGRPSGNTGFLADGVGSIDELRALAEVDGKCPNGRNARATLARWEASHGSTNGTPPAGRWPTNVVLDDTQAAVLDEMSGESVSNIRKHSEGHTPKSGTAAYGDYGVAAYDRGVSDRGGASRFFPTFRYEAKAPTSERPKVNGVAHSTVKPLDLMSWLVRLVTPPGGTVLEPFAGSGTTVEACVIEGFKCIAIEKTDEYLPLTVARIHRRRDPVAAIKLAGDDLGLFDLGEDTA